MLYFYCLIENYVHTCYDVFKWIYCSPCCLKKLIILLSLLADIPNSYSEDDENLLSGPEEVNEMMRKAIKKNLGYRSGERRSLPASTDTLKLMMQSHFQ